MLLLTLSEKNNWSKEKATAEEPLKETAEPVCILFVIGYLLSLRFTLDYEVAVSQAIRRPICHFLLRDFSGTFVEVMRKCPAGTSYCAARVSNATGLSSLVVDHYEFYCENERNITLNLQIPEAPNQGCYPFGPSGSEFVCFCHEDFCNNKENMEEIFLSFRKFVHLSSAPLPPHVHINNHHVHPQNVLEFQPHLGQVQPITSNIVNEQVIAMSNVETATAPVRKVAANELKSFNPLPRPRQDGTVIRNRAVRDTNRNLRPFETKVKTQQIFLINEDSPKVKHG
ncbi:unnamed protein product [Bursaphelenchus xylophilus]|uniref:(pine wood nematode) hypothetical protein n=1 Tax=Bursaphelenchus xylophilus TaxID=6326 RepID=A0A7I8X0B8_BURXY|nr:unnamed protein product [Bursaphelenchus xylophilus]CAG9129769.1 unnamed protein product [Bursaphelenchus xylophilus]